MLNLTLSEEDSFGIPFVLGVRISPPVSPPVDLGSRGWGGIALLLRCTPVLAKFKCVYINCAYGFRSMCNNVVIHFFLKLGLAMEDKVQQDARQL